MSAKAIDFDESNVNRTIVRLSYPIILAQILNLLYSMVDRIYIGHIPNIGAIALTSIGICFPLLQIVSAFSLLYGFNGGSPLCNIERGRGNIKEAEKVQGNAFTLLLITALALTLIVQLFHKPILYLFGASESTYQYSKEYLLIYSLGFVFSLITLGLNAFINSQGFVKVGMFTVALGSSLNLILDPILIFYLGLGVKGAAFATIFSQFVSSLFVLSFLTSKKAILRLSKESMKLESKRVKKIISLGLSGFFMGATNSVVQIVSNKMALIYGGDLFVGALTIINSIREMFSTPISGFISGASPVMSYNYGAKRYDRVVKASNFTLLVTLAFSTILTITILIFPTFYISLFNNKVELINETKSAMRIYFALFMFMAFQNSGQSTFVALGKSRYAIFFSLFRKVMIVAPLTIILPFFIGKLGVVVAEPISNLIGGLASFIVMKRVTRREFNASKPLL